MAGLSDIVVSVLTNSIIPMVYEEYKRRRQQGQTQTQSQVLIVHHYHHFDNNILPTQGQQATPVTVARRPQIQQNRPWIS